MHQRLLTDDFHPLPTTIASRRHGVRDATNKSIGDGAGAGVAGDPIGLLSRGRIASRHLLDRSPPASRPRTQWSGRRFRRPPRLQPHSLQGQGSHVGSKRSLSWSFLLRAFARSGALPGRCVSEGDVGPCICKRTRGLGGNHLWRSKFRITTVAVAVQRRHPLKP
jgi:hypothetical protein